MTGLRWLRATLAPEAPVEPLVRLRAEVGLAQLAFIAGDYLASFAAIEFACGPPGRSVTMWCWPLPRDRRLCLVVPGPGSFAALFQESLEAARRSGDDWTRSTGLAGLGWARYFADARCGDRAAAGGYRADRPFGTAAARCDGRARLRRD